VTQLIVRFAFAASGICLPEAAGPSARSINPAITALTPSEKYLLCQTFLRCRLLDTADPDVSTHLRAYAILFLVKSLVAVEARG